MKHLKTFDGFNESFLSAGRKFFTGHESKESEGKAKEDFMKKLDDISVKVKKTPNQYAQGSNWEKAKQDLISKADDNKFRGDLKEQRGGRDRRIFVTYTPKGSGFQQIASGAASGERNA